MKSIDTGFRRVSVRDLYVQCMLQTSHHGEPAVCASDCCRAPADSVVELPSGIQTWRCPEHEGVQYMSNTGKVLSRGMVSYFVNRKMED